MVSGLGRGGGAAYRERYASSKPTREIKAMRKISVVLMASLIVGCAAFGQKQPAVTVYKPDSTKSDQERRDAMVGNWVGEAPLKDGGERKWLVQRSNEGTYVVTFIVIPEGEQPEISQEVGFWGISGPVYFTITKGWLRQDGNVEPNDPTKAYFYDAYKIVALTQERFEYESFSTGNRFIVRRVGEEFTPNDLVNSVNNEA